MTKTWIAVAAVLAATAAHASETTPWASVNVSGPFTKVSMPAAKDSAPAPQAPQTPQAPAPVAVQAPVPPVGHVPTHEFAEGGCASCCASCGKGGCWDKLKAWFCYVPMKSPKCCKCCGSANPRLYTYFLDHCRDGCGVTAADCCTHCGPVNSPCATGHKFFAMPTGHGCGTGPCLTGCGGR